MKKAITLKEAKEKYKISKEAKVKNEAFAKKVKLTFIIFPLLCLIAYVIINVIFKVQY